MKVAMYYKNSDVRIEEMPVPEIGEDEILVKMAACGICGSDVMEWYRVKTAPRVLGHEMTGEIVKVGDKVKKYSVGQRVFVSHHVPCNTCRYCLAGHHSACETLHTTNFFPGGFAEYIRVPAINVDRGVFPLPDGMTYEQGTFIEPLACVYRAQRRMGFPTGKDVLVIGSGISGLLHIKLAAALGAREILAVDVNDFRLGKAREFGATHTIRADENTAARVKEILGREGADQVILCTGARSALKAALDSVDRGGTVMFFATPPPGEDVPMPMGRFWRNEVTVMTSYAGAPVDIEGAMSLIASGRVVVDDMVTHVLPLEKAQEGFDLVASAGNSLKVILKAHMYRNGQI